MPRVVRTAPPGAKKYANQTRQNRYLMDTGDWTADSGKWRYERRLPYIQSLGANHKPRSAE